MKTDVRVWASGLEPADTGVGVFQHEIYTRLTEHGMQVDFGPGGVSPRTRQFGATRLTSIARRAIASVPRSYEAALVCATPGPAIIGPPSVLVVYDLRWRRTRSLGGRLYRAADLRRQIRAAKKIVAISACTRRDLVAFAPEVDGRVEVVHPGPGQIRPEDFVAGTPGAAVLVGRGPHKRNQLLAEALVAARPEWVTDVIGLSLDAPTEGILRGGYGHHFVAHHGLTADATRAIFRRAAVFVSAAGEEGFGLPLVEALAAGCQVVAVRAPIIDEVVGGAGVILDGGGVAELAEQLAAPKAWVDEADRRARVERYSWDHAATRVAELLRVVA